MIVSIFGKISRVEPFLCEISCESGLTYQLKTSLNTSSGLSDIKERISLLVHHRFGMEGKQELYGFLDTDERDLFSDLIKVNGVGPSSALKIISSHGVDYIKESINNGDVSALSKVKGVGPKTAEVIIIALRGTLQDSKSVEMFPDHGSDAIKSLIVLGYTKPEATSLVKSALSKSPMSNTEQIIKLCLSK